MYNHFDQFTRRLPRLSTLLILPPQTPVELPWTTDHGFLQRRGGGVGSGSVSHVSYSHGDSPLDDPRLETRSLPIPISNPWFRQKEQFILWTNLIKSSVFVRNIFLFPCLFAFVKNFLLIFVFVEPHIRHVKFVYIHIHIYIKLV